MMWALDFLTLQKHFPKFGVWLIHAGARVCACACPRAPAREARIVVTQFNKEARCAQRHI